MGQGAKIFECSELEAFSLKFKEENRGNHSNGPSLATMKPASEHYYQARKQWLIMQKIK